MLRRTAPEGNTGSEFHPFFRAGNLPEKPRPRGTGFQPVGLDGMGEMRMPQPN